MEEKERIENNNKIKETEELERECKRGERRSSEDKGERRKVKEKTK